MGTTFYGNAGVPVNIGEVGQSPRNFTPERGSGQWAVDMFDLFEQYGMSAQWFDRHSGNFGDPVGGDSRYSLCLYGEATANGIRQLQVKPGSAGKGSAKVLGQNSTSKGMSSLPTGIAGPLSAATEVAMQMRVSDGVCVSTAMSYAKTREASRYSGAK